MMISKPVTLSITLAFKGGAASTMRKRRHTTLTNDDVQQAFEQRKAELMAAKKMTNANS